MGFFSRTKSHGNNAPAGENSVRLTVGESEDDKLQRSMDRLKRARMMDRIGAVAAISGAGVGGAALGNFLSDRFPGESNLPAYNQPKTVQEHAQYYAATLPDETPEDYMVFEGIRQGLLGGNISAMDVDRMAIEGAFSERAQFLLGDIHNFGASGLSVNPREIAEMIQQDGGDGTAFLMEQQQLRNELGINTPV